MPTRSVIATAGKKFRTNNISKRVQKIVISPIKEMSILADEWQKKSKTKVISFGQGIPYLDTPPNIKNKIREALGTVTTAQYTLEPGIPKLRELVADLLQKEKGAARVKADKEIMISTGAQESMACALATVIDDGDEVLLPEPAYASHIEQILQWGGVPKFVSRIETKGWQLNLKAFDRRVTKKTKAVLLSNPANPTGTVLTLAEMNALAKFARKHNLIIISDETYDFLTYDGVKCVSFASIKSVRDRIIVISSFSKKYRMTGYRVGYAFADEGLIDHMLKVHDALTICAPAIAQEGAIAALKGPQNSVRELVGQMTENRKLFLKEMDDLGQIFEYQKPAGTYYVFVKVKTKKVNSFKLALKILREANIIVIPGAAFGPSGEGHIRFSFAGKPENIREGMKRLNKWAMKWKREGYKI